MSPCPICDHQHAERCEMVRSTSGPSRRQSSTPHTPVVPLSRRRSRRRANTAQHLALIPLLVALALLPCLVTAQVTVYTGQATATSAGAPAANYTGLPAYDPTVLTAPDPPQPPVQAYTLTVPGNSQGVADVGLTLSQEQKGNFLGFSIELSIADTILGESGKTLQVPFLNYLANIKNRAGQGPIIRVGGNTQDSSTIYPQGFNDGSELQKIKNGVDVYGNAVNTPVINYSPELLYTMNNISTLVNAEWYFGLAFNESDTQTLTGNVPIAAQWAQNVLGPNLRGLVVGNEPDLYVGHNHRPQGWGVGDYINEYNALTQEILNAKVLSNSSIFVGPSLCCQEPGFELNDVLNAGYLSDTNSPNVAAITVQHYPSNNCQIGGVINPQDIFYQFLNHTSAQTLTADYYGDLAAVKAAGKEMVMLEMNTASCGGFQGLSDSFGAALWMTDWSLQMASAGFSAALMHVGGQNVYYNPFTPPPSSVGPDYKWTTGSVYYPTLVVSEVFGQSNQSRIVDLAADNANSFHPAYAVYEGDVPTRLVLFNYVSDQSGASNLQVSVNINGSQIADTVSVRYLAAPSVSDQYNLTWAGQSLGTSFNSDGRLYGNVQTDTITCADGTCVIPVPAPSIALVFLTPNSLTLSSVPDDATKTYDTTVIGQGAATVDPGALETSNGQYPDKIGSSSKGGNRGAASRRAGLESYGPLLATLSLLGALIQWA